MRRTSNRCGAAVVEFAITAPILFLLVFAAIEFSRANMLVHTANIAATSGARAGIISGATAEDCQQAVYDELQPLGVNEAYVTVKPEVITPSTDMITIGVLVPINTKNCYLTPRFFLGDSVVKVVSITREAHSAEDVVGTADAANQEVAVGLVNGDGTLLSSGEGQATSAEEQAATEKAKSDILDFLKDLFGI